jgi:pimeloyl-ACP methyl ester carboxylesterase
MRDEMTDPGTMRDGVVTKVNGQAESLLLARCGHSPHSDRPDEVLEAAGRFVR